VVRARLCRGQCDQFAGYLPPAIKAPLLTFDTLLLATAMAALGLETRVAKLRSLGPKPLLLAALLWLWLILGGAAMVHTLA